jgi:hypothetical protein
LRSNQLLLLPVSVRPGPDCRLALDLGRAWFYSLRQRVRRTFAI